jgi:hypothetical protein
LPVFFGLLWAFWAFWAFGGGSQTGPKLGTFVGSYLTPPPGCQWKCWQAWSALLEAGLQVIGGPPLPLVVAVRFPMHLTMRCVRLQSPDAQHACAARGAGREENEVRWALVLHCSSKRPWHHQQWQYRSAQGLPSTLCNADDVIFQWREGGGVGVTYVGIAGVSSAPSYSQQTPHGVPSPKVRLCSPFPQLAHGLPLPTSTMQRNLYVV